jgi:uncharacterized protein YcbK (DUF882 family)
MITMKEYLMGRIKESELDAELLTNAKLLLKKVNLIREAYGKPMYVSSGYRSPEVNKAAGGAKKSNHMLCLAVDIADASGVFKKWLVANTTLLEQVGIWCEHPDATPTWAHLQIVPPRSGNRFFKP